MNDWVDKRRNRYETQLEYLDAISHRFMYVITALPPNLSAILYHVLCSYSEGIQPKAIARLMFKGQQSISGGLKCLHDAGLVSRRQGKTRRETIYFVADRDFLLVNAIRWDWRFPAFLKRNRDRMDADLADEFVLLVTGDTAANHAIG